VRGAVAWRSFVRRTRTAIHWLQPRSDLESVVFVLAILRSPSTPSRSRCGPFVSTEGAEWPDPPVNVRVRRRTGEVIPVDCLFDGVDEKGVAIWNVIWDGDVLDFSAGDQLLVGRLPGRTALVFAQEI
jgi:hypothetical protein